MWCAVVVDSSVSEQSYSVAAAGLKLGLGAVVAGYGL